MFHQIVAERVARFLDAKGVESDFAEELVSAGLLCFAEVLAKNPQPSQPYIRKAIDRAIVKAWQRDRQLAVPPSTRWDRTARGDDPGDLIRHSLHDVIGPNGLLPEQPCWWADAESQWFARVDEWLEIIETYEALYALTRDDADRAILEARWDNGLSIELGPVPVSEVATVVGLSPRTVQSRLNDMERRYCKQANRRLPTTKRVHR